MQQFAFFYLDIKKCKFLQKNVFSAKKSLFNDFGSPYVHGKTALEFIVFVIIGESKMYHCTITEYIQICHLASF